MVRVLVIAVISSISSLSLAHECNTNLQLVCHGVYLSEGVAVTTSGDSTPFMDENGDEPSLKNCAAAIYLRSSLVPHTTVRVHSTKDLPSDAVKTNALAIQIFDSLVDGQVSRMAYYSHGSEIASTVGETLSLGVLHLPKAVPTDSGVVTEVAVSCTVK